MTLIEPITKTETITEITDIVLTDSFERKFVTATYTTNLGSSERPVLLWKGPEYDAIGDYTNAQVQARLVQILSTPK